MKKLFKRRLATLLCIALLSNQLTSMPVVYADYHSASNVSSELTKSVKDTFSTPSNATSSNADTTIKEDINDLDKEENNEISDSTASDSILKQNLGTPSVASLRSVTASSEAIYYLEDAFGSPDEIDLYYGHQLRTPEAALYYMIGNYLSYAEELYSGASGSSRWTQSISVNFSELNDEEYSDFAIDVDRELEIYEQMAMEAFSLDHPEYDLTCLNITNEPNYNDTSVIVDGEKLYSGNIRLDITFNIRGSEHPTYIVYKYHQLMDALESIPVSGSSRLNQVKSIHDYLCNNVSYSADEDDWSTNTAYGAIVQKKANCNGFARAFKTLCDYYDIPCVIVAGIELGDCVGNTVTYNEDSLRQHMWNYVQMEDDVWYAVVADANARNSSEDYFLVGSETVPDNDGFSFIDTYNIHNVVLTHWNSFENSGRTTHSLLVPELSEEKYGFSSITNVGLYSEENNLDSRISKLDYAAGNFYYNYGMNIDIEDPFTSTYAEEYYLHFTIKIAPEWDNLRDTYITIVLPDGFSFSPDSVDRERNYNLLSSFDNNEMWVKIHLLYSETAPPNNMLNMQYTIAQGEYILSQGGRTITAVNIYSPIDHISLTLNDDDIIYSGWNTEMFFNDSTQYNKNLALFSAYMSDMIEGSDKAKLADRLKKDLTALGFSKINYSGVSYSSESEEYVFATKKVIYDGKVNTILLCAVQGSDFLNTWQTIYDWKGNLDYQEEKYHPNIAICASNLLDSLDFYCYIQDLTLEDSSIRKLVTGHSRGAGIANMTAAGLNSRQSGTLESLYCYTFAALNVIHRDLNNANLHSNIFNLVNFSDLVPFVPGFKLGKYGNSGVFNINDNLFNLYSLGALRKLSLNFRETSFYYFLKDCCALSLHSNHYMPVYENAIAEYDYDTLNWDFDTLCDKIDQDFDQHAVLYNAFFDIALGPYFKISSAIMQPPAKLFLNTANLIFHLIKCPVDIEVTDSSGNVVCRITNNQIEFLNADDIGIIIAGDQKEIIYPVDSGYHLNISGYDNGTMNYKLIMPDENGNDCMLYAFDNLPVSMNQTVLTVENNGTSPVFKNGLSEEITANEVIDVDESDYISIQLDANMDTVFTPGTQNYLKGDFVWAYAGTDGDETFIGWFDQDGNLISTEQFYIFSASESVHYTARFSSEGETYCSLYGHTIVTDEAVAPTQTTSGLTQGSHCSVCGLVIKEQTVIPPLSQEIPENPSDGTEQECNENNTQGTDTENTGSGGSSSGGNGSGGSSSGGSGGGGSSSGGGGGGGSSIGPSSPAHNSLPEYVVTGSWSQTEDGKWMFTDSNNTVYKNMWAAVYNPYANVLAGQSNFDWFYFDANGYMATGWLSDGGYMYYLNPISDGTLGKMFTGWQLIDNKWYYFNEVSDGTRGSMKKDTWIGEYYVDPNGIWIA